MLNANGERLLFLHRNVLCRAVCGVGFVSVYGEDFDVDLLAAGEVCQCKAGAGGGSGLCPLLAVKGFINHVALRARYLAPGDLCGFCLRRGKCGDLGCGGLGAGFQHRGERADALFGGIQRADLEIIRLARSQSFAVYLCYGQAVG